MVLSELRRRTIGTKTRSQPPPRPFRRKSKKKGSCAPCADAQQAARRGKSWKTGIRTDYGPLPKPTEGQLA
eukprot:scaffold21500_cov119-Cylindrotheca_fusiformis.AAC.1